MPRKKTLKPLETSRSYLIGWFKVETKGDHAKAAKMADAYLDKLEKDNRKKAG